MLRSSMTALALMLAVTSADARGGGTRGVPLKDLLQGVGIHEHIRTKGIHVAPYDPHPATTRVLNDFKAVFHQVHKVIEP
jgi:hypothetical protein